MPARIKLHCSIVIQNREFQCKQCRVNDNYVTKHNINISCNVLITQFNTIFIDIAALRTGTQTLSSYINYLHISARLHSYKHVNC